MTSLGTVVAIGMMPLNLWIYSRSWTDEELIIPYLNILISLGMTVGPAVVGILIRWRLEKMALEFVKVFTYCNSSTLVIYCIKVISMTLKYDKCIFLLRVVLFPLTSQTVYV